MIKIKKREKLPGKRLFVDALMIALVLAGVFLLDGNLCIYKRTLGIPCPGCGMTRAFISLAKLDIRSAFYYHPLFILPVLPALLFLFKKKQFVVQLYKSNRFWLAILFIVLSVYLYRMIALFPDQAPMDFNSKAVLPSLLIDSN